MKKLLTILCLVLLVSCSNDDPLDEQGNLLSDQYIVRDGVLYQVNSQTPFTGSFEAYHDNGLLDRKPNYKDGKLHGPWEGYYKNGQLRGKGNYKDGKLDGVYEWYDENGQLEKRGNYKDGVLQEYKNNKPSDDEIHEIIKEFVVRLNENTPRKTDQNSILVTHRWSDTDKRRVIYIVKVNNINLEDGPNYIQRSKQMTESRLKSFFCNQPEAKIFEDLNVNLEYIYSDFGDNFLFSIEIYSSDCV